MQPTYPSQNTIPGNDFAMYGDSATSVLSLLQLDYAQGRLPTSFPLALWQEQQARYDYYWSWYRGDALEDVMGKSKDGRTVYRYPLRINPIRNFARKHAALLFGEVPDTPTPMVKTMVTPKLIYATPSEKQKKAAAFTGALVNEVWTASSGRSIQYENGLLSQFLGGSVYKVNYTPFRKDLLVPITVTNIYPNFFLPVWSNDNFYDLLEAWVVYRIPAAQAAQRWGITPQSGWQNVLYVEYYSKTHESRWVDGKPLKATFPNGTEVTYDHVPNVFGKVPFFYIPRMREGSFYGSSFVPDIAGLAIELNSRAADEGDAMRKTVNQRYVGSNITGNVEDKPLGSKGGTYIDIGLTNPALQDEPSLKPLDPPKWDKAFSDHKNFLWTQTQREGGMGPIAFGEDEGSQRSALTLAFRMWPSTVVAKAQRTFMTDGLNEINKFISQIAAEKRIEVASQRVPADFAHQFDYAPDWLPMIPRDREAQVNEIVLRLQSGSISIEKALADFGDVPDVAEEVERIKSWMQFMAEMKRTQKGAEEDVVTPVASTGLRDN